MKIKKEAVLDISEFLNLELPILEYQNKNSENSIIF